MSSCEKIHSFAVKYCHQRAPFVGFCDGIGGGGVIGSEFLVLRGLIFLL